MCVCVCVCMCACVCVCVCVIPIDACVCVCPSDTCVYVCIQVMHVCTSVHVCATRLLALLVLKQLHHIVTQVMQCKHMQLCTIYTGKKWQRMTLADFSREFRLTEMEKQAYMLKTVCFFLSKSLYLTGHCSCSVYCLLLP